MFKSAWCSSMRTWVWVPSPTYKSRHGYACTCNPVLWGLETEILADLTSCQPSSRLHKCLSQEIGREGWRKDFDSFLCPLLVWPLFVHTQSYAHGTIHTCKHVFVYFVLILFIASPLPLAFCVCPLKVVPSQKFLRVFLIFFFYGNMKKKNNLVTSMLF